MAWLTKTERLFRKDFTKFKRYLVIKRFLSYTTIGYPDECWEWTHGINGKGYGQFDWEDKGIKLSHVAAYVLFIGSIPKRKGKKKLFVCHSCDNLWLGTQKQNIADMHLKGRDNHKGGVGERNSHAKLTWDDVDEIRRMYTKKERTLKGIAEKFNVSSSTVQDIVYRKHWNKSELQ